MKEKSNPTHRAEELEFQFLGNPTAKIFFGGPPAEASMQSSSHLVNSQSTDVRREFSRILLRKLGGRGEAFRQNTVLQFLSRVDLSDITAKDAELLLDTYEGVVLRQNPDSDPSFLTEAGDVLREPIVATYAGQKRRVSERVQHAWDRAIHNNDGKSSLWDDVPEKVFALTTAFKQQEEEQKSVKRIRPENLPPQETVIENFLFDRVEELVASDHVVWSGVHAEAYQAMHGLDAEQATDLATRLVRDMAPRKDGQEWEIEQLDGAIELFSVMDFRKVDTETFTGALADVVRRQPKNANLFGGMYALVRLQEYLPEEIATHQEVSQAWIDTVQRMQRGPDSAFLQKVIDSYASEAKLEDIVAAYPNKTARQLAEEFGLEGPIQVYRMVHEAIRTGKVVMQPKKLGPQASSEVESRDQRIIAELEAGVTPREIAEREGFTSHTYVSTIVRRYEEKHGVRVNKPDLRKQRPKKDPNASKEPPISSKENQPPQQTSQLSIAGYILRASQELRDRTIFPETPLVDDEPVLGEATGQSIGEQEAAYDAQKDTTQNQRWKSK